MSEQTAESDAPQYPAGHGFTPGKFSGGCRVMLARYACNYSREEHDPALPAVDVDVFGYRRGRVTPPGVCSTCGGSFDSPPCSLNREIGWSGHTRGGGAAAADKSEAGQ